jgi:hypothetical protein
MPDWLEHFLINVAAHPGRVSARHRNVQLNRITHSWPALTTPRWSRARQRSLKEFPLQLPLPVRNDNHCPQAESRRQNYPDAENGRHAIIMACDHHGKLQRYGEDPHAGQQRECHILGPSTAGRCPTSGAPGNRANEPSVRPAPRPRGPSPVQACALSSAAVGLRPQ